MSRTRAVPTAERHEVDGIAYHVARAGTPGRPPLLLVHGFMGSGASWAEFVPALAANAEILAVDLPGHGLTPAPPDPARASVEETADDLAAILDRLELGPAAIIGYSLGARVALRLAVEHPAAVSRLVLESPSPGFDGEAERRARREADEALAAALDTGGLAAFVESWEGQPVFASQASLPPDRRELIRRERLANDPAGLATSLRGAGQGTMEPLAGRLDAVAAPTLVIAGALDPIGRRRAELVAGRIPRARIAVVPDAGHRIHLERPAVYAKLVTDFLRETHA